MMIKKTGKLIVEHKQINIVQLQVDAIVNAANSKLYEGGGVCGVIFEACGPSQLRKECQEYIQKHGEVKTSNVVVTDSYKLKKNKIKHIIHAVGPIYNYRLSHQDQSKELKNCVTNILTKAFIHLHLESVAIPAISSGIYGFPKDKCAEAFKSSIEEFNNDNDISGEVILANIDNETYEIFQKVFENKPNL